MERKTVHRERCPATNYSRPCFWIWGWEDHCDCCGRFYADVMKMPVLVEVWVRDV